MIGLDTNVLVRYFAQDDPVQAKLAERVIDGLTVESRGYVSLVSLVELCWVLVRAYELDRQRTADIVERLLESSEIAVNRSDAVRRALRTYRRSTADMADCLIDCLGTEDGCDTTLTFDVRAARDTGMTLLDASVLR